MLGLVAPWTHQSRSLYLLAAVAALILLGTVSSLRPGPQLAVAPLTGNTHTSNGHDYHPFEIQGLTLGPKFTRPSQSLTGHDHVPWLLSSLRSRFQQTMFPDERGVILYPDCTLNPERYGKTALGPLRSQSRWWSKQRRSTVSFAINLRDSEHIIPAQAMALLEAIAHLLQNNKVYVSIYENSSSDKTRALLSDLGAALHAMGVDGLWLHSSNMLSDFGNQDRIVMLSEIRNLALAPLMPYASSDHGVGTLLVMNDVLTCTSDILELVHQQRLHQADMAFGMDWGTVDHRVRQGEPGYLYEDDPRYPDNPPQTKTTRYYDAWVGRGISGNGVYDFARPGGYNPVSDNETWVNDAYSTENKTIHQRWLIGLAIPAYSGWGGMSAFDALLFTREHVRFRSTVSTGWSGGNAIGALGTWGRLVSSEGYLESDCPGASECEYIARDIWNLRQGRARVVLAPQTRTTYNIKDWLVMSDKVPVTRRDGPDLLDEDVITWSEYSVPESVICIPTRTAQGTSKDVWAENSHRIRLNPLWTPTNETTSHNTDIENEEQSADESSPQQQDLEDVEDDQFAASQDDEQ